VIRISTRLIRPFRFCTEQCVDAPDRTASIVQHFKRAEIAGLLSFRLLIGPAHWPHGDVQRIAG